MDQKERAKADAAASAVTTTSPRAPMRATGAVAPSATAASAVTPSSGVLDKLVAQAQA